MQNIASVIPRPDQSLIDEGGMLFRKYADNPKIVHDPAFNGQLAQHEQAMLDHYAMYIPGLKECNMKLYYRKYELVCSHQTISCPKSVKKCIKRCEVVHEKNRQNENVRAKIGATVLVVALVAGIPLVIIPTTRIFVTIPIVACVLTAIWRQWQWHKDLNQLSEAYRAIDNEIAKYLSPRLANYPIELLHRGFIGGLDDLVAIEVIAGYRISL